MEVVSLTTAWAMVHAGLGAALLPLQVIGDTTFDTDISLFTLSGHVSSRQPVIITRRGQYLSEYAQYAIELLISPK
jgi:DNA-binding transcriptional LysR family regulator